MAASGAPVRTPRRGPAPIASFDHDGSDESSPESKQTCRLPEIVEDSSSATGSDALAPPEQRARSHSTPAAGALQPAAPRIDISRASSSSHQDSRDSSPELALFAGAAPQGAEGLGFREDGALDLRSSTEELAFLEPAPGERPAPAPPSRRHSRKDSQGSEAALLAVSGRTSRLSSVGSQCSAHSALSAFSRTGRVSRLSVASVASGASRSPSPHKMLLETSFCGPKPIETDPEICAAAVEERLLEMANLSAGTTPTTVTTAPVASTPPVTVVATVEPPVDARDRREVRTEATVERPAPRPPPPRSAAPTPTPAPAPAPVPAATPAPISAAPVPDDDKRQKETKNRVRAEERRARSRERRDDSGESRTKSRSKDIIRIRLKPSEEYDDDDDEDATDCGPTASASKPVTLELGASGSRPTRPTDLAPSEPAPAPRRPARDSRTPSPAGVVVSRKSSFCSLFKSRETIASPESPSDALRRKKSLNEGRSRSRSRDRSATPTSATKIKGSVLSLFKTPRKSATSPSPSSREGSPVVQPQRPAPPQPPRAPRGEKLKYYEDAKDGIIHIPLRTPPDEVGAPAREPDARPASAPQQRVPPSSIGMTVALPAPAPSAAGVAHASTSGTATRSPSKPIQRTVLPDGSIIIPLRSPTEKNVEDDPPARSRTSEESRPTERTSRSSSTVEIVSAVVSPGLVSGSSGPTSTSPPGAAAGLSGTDVTPSPDPAPPDAAPERVRSRRERLIFTTHVGSAEQVFCTQFSITKTPSVTSEISGSFPSFPDVEDPVAVTPTPAVVNNGATAPPAEPLTPAERSPRPEPNAGSSTASPQEPGRDSSESEASSEAAPARGGNDVERRGLVVQESFEDELPYVPTTLPQERSLALPMVPVRERGDVRVAAVERPRATAPRPSPAVRPPRVPLVPQVPPVPPTTPAPRVPPAEDKIRIKLPRRPRTASASAAPPRPERARARSGSDGMETRPKAEWIDFEEVPERRKQPKRIQTLPSAAVAGAALGAGARDVVFSYVEPEECRCECHARADDETPLLLDDPDPRLSTSPVEGGAGAAGAGEGARVQLSVQLGRPFTGDLELRHDTTPQESAGARQ